MPFCEVAGGIRLYYEDFGEGPAIIFTPAGSLTHKMWESQVAALAGNGFRAIAYDYRGTGDSDKPRAGYGPDLLAGDLCALVERLALGRAVLAGHGLGSHVSLLAAAARPDLARGLVLASTAPWFAGEHDGVAAGLSAEFLAFIARANELKDARGVPYPQACAELGSDWIFHRPQHPAVQHAVLEQALAWPQFVINEMAKGMAGIDHRGRFAQLRCPTLIVQGRHDRKQRYAGAAWMAGRIVGARLVTLEDSAHMGQIEEITAFNAALASFLRELA